MPMGVNAKIVSSPLYVDNKSVALSSNAASLDNLMVTVIGLEKGDEAVLTLAPEGSQTDADSLLSSSLISEGSEEIATNMSSKLADGYYQIQIKAPDKYFREPKAWLFMVSGGKLINPNGKSVVFQLIPPGDQIFQPHRGPNVTTVQSANQVENLPPSSPPPSMMECMMSLSATPKQPISENTTTSLTPQYFCYYSTLPCPGLEGRFTVVNPGVIHGSTPEEAVDHVYAQQTTSGGPQIEAGWAEVNFTSDTRYMYEYDSYHNSWYLFNLPSNPLHVEVMYNPSNWYAMYDNGSSWVTLNYANLGISNSAFLVNGGEVQTNNSTYPSFPTSTTDISKLEIANSWVNWDWQRWATTYLMTCSNYNLQNITYYYHFTIQSN